MSVPIYSEDTVQIDTREGLEIIPSLSWRRRLVRYLLAPCPSFDLRVRHKQLAPANPKVLLPDFV